MGEAFAIICIDTFMLKQANASPLHHLTNIVIKGTNFSNIFVKFHGHDSIVAISRQERWLP